MNWRDAEFEIVDLGYSEKRYQVVRLGNVVAAYGARYIAARVVDALNEAQREDEGRA